jgi:hypothetical protein
MENKSYLDLVLTFSEASQIWGLGDSTLRSMIGDGRLKEGLDYRKSGKVWLITDDAMRKLYGNPKKGDKNGD